MKEKRCNLGPLVTPEERFIRYQAEQKRNLKNEEEEGGKDKAREKRMLMSCILSHHSSDIPSITRPTPPIPEKTKQCPDMEVEGSRGEGSRGGRKIRKPDVKH